MRITLFPDVRATSAESYETTWADLAARCINPPVYPSKQDCPLIKLAAFGDQRTIKGSFRHDPNVLAVSGLEGDYDAGLIQPSVAAMLLELAGIQALVYTSPSHTSAAPRWRVLAPFAAEHTPTERRELLGRLNGALGGVLAHESFTLSQTYYVGRVAGVEYEAHQSNGAPIDFAPHLPPVYPASAVVTDRPHAERTATPETIEELRSALAAIPADEYFEWISVGQALSELGDDGFELWDEWSQRSNKYDGEAAQWKWGTFTGDRTGFAAVFAKAQALGWENPKRRPPVDLAQVFGSAEAARPAPSAAVDRSGNTMLGPDDQKLLFAGCVYVQDRDMVYTPAGYLLDKSRFDRDGRYKGWSFVMDRSNGRVSKSAWDCFTGSEAVIFPDVRASCFRPELPAGAIVEEEGIRLLNTYTPIDTLAIDGDPAPFLGLMKKLYPVKRDREILLSYAASCVQNVGYKFQWWPVLQGAEGNGKSAIIRCVSHAIGHRYTHLPDIADMAKNGMKFNSWVDRSLFIGIEEIYVPHKKDFLEQFKTLVTNDRIQIEAKGMNQVMGDNRANGIMCTNHKDGIPITVDGRRYCALYSAHQSKEDILRDGMGGDYFPDLYDWFKGRGKYAQFGANYGFAIVNHYLRTYKIAAEFDPARSCQQAPQTSSTREAIELSLGVIEQEIQEAIESGAPGFQGGWISSKALDVLMLERRMTLPRNKRLSSMRLLGYEHHPNLRKGRSSVDMPGTTDRPTLYIKSGHWAAGLKDGAEILKAYISAQLPGAKPMVGLVAAGR